MDEKRKDSVNRYKKKFDNVIVYLPKGGADAIRATGESVSGLVNKLLAEWATVNNVIDYPAVAPSVDEGKEHIIEEMEKNRDEKPIKCATDPKIIDCSLDDFL